MTKLTIGSSIKVENPDKQFVMWLRNESGLEMVNPAFLTNERLGYSNYNVPRKLYYYHKMGNDYILPFGIVRALFRFLKNNGTEYTFETVFKGIAKIKYDSSIKLYDYQEKAAREAISAKNGVVVMPAGSGKTQTALEIISRIGGRTLWLTHTIDLLKQSLDRARANIDNIGIGQISSGKIDVGTHITFATVQTMSKIDPNMYRDYFDVVVVDECHRVCGTPASSGMFYKVINSLNARYKYGLTATPFRNISGTEMAMFGLLGDVIIEIDKSVVKTRKASVVRVDTQFEIDDTCTKTDGTLDYVKMISSMVSDKKRNDLIVKHLILCGSRRCLVLSDRVAHLEELQSRLGHGLMISGKMTSKKGKLERQRAIEAMRDGSARVLFATYSLAKEGLDIPLLDTLIMATPKKDRATVIQAIGRIERDVENKLEPICYDFVDKTGFHIGQWNKRRAIYKKNGNPILQE